MALFTWPHRIIIFGVLFVVAFAIVQPITVFADEDVLSRSSRILANIDDATGVLVYQYPITLPVGRENATPTLDLIYNSQNKNSASEVGFGWSLSMPTIERVNKRGTDVLFSNMDFISSLSGELVQISESAFAAKVDDGTRLNYEFSSDVWVVTAKDGLTYTFGDASEARLADPVDSSKIHTWYLTTIEDTRGNFITYNYDKYESDNAIYPASITYTNDAFGNGPFTITFVRETRPDSYTSYTKGFLTQITERIREISVTTNDLQTHNYVFGYGEGENGRSMLETITESAQNAFGETVTLPDMSFAYTSADVSLEYNGEVSFSEVTYTEAGGAEQTTPFSLSDEHVHVMDVNGDGLKDIVKSYNTQVGGVDYPIFWVLVNNGHGWEVDTSWTQPEYSYVNGDGTTVSNIFTFGNGEVVGDWNGDALDDLIMFWPEDIGGGESMQQSTVLLNNGHGWEQDMAVTADVASITDVNGSSIELLVDLEADQSYIGDLNGDGLIDYMYAFSVQVNGIHNPHFAVWYNQNGSLVWDSTVSVPWVGSVPLSLDSDIRPIEINGDGLIDFMYAYNYQINGVDYPSFWVLLNNGHGWTQDTAIQHPTYESEYLSTNASTSSWDVMDVNGDYLSDWVNLSSIEVDGVSYNRTSVLINTGRGWIQDDSLLTVGEYEYIDANGTAQTGFPTTGADTDALFFDVNGDGLDDILNATYYQADGNYYTQNWLMENTGYTANLVDTMTLPEGGIYTYTYQATSAYTNNNGELLNANLPSTYNTVRSVTSDNGFGETTTTTYEYADGAFYYADQYNRRFAGFGSIITTNDLGESTTTYYHQGNEDDSASYESKDSFSKIGQPYRSEIRNASDALAKTIITTWGEDDLGHDNAFVHQDDELELLYNGNGGTDHTDRATTYTYDSTTGNLITQTEYGEVNESDDDRTTTYTYATDVASIITALPAAVTLTDSDGTTVSETRYIYDNLEFGWIETGNVTKEEVWIFGSDYAATSYTYDTYGNVLTQTDPLGNTTTTVYDADNLYPATITNALAQTQTFEYNLANGLPTSITTVNGVITQTDYDGLGRPIEERHSSSNDAATLETTKIWSYFDDGLYPDYPRSIKLREYLSETLYKETIDYLDALDRVIETKVLDDAATGYNESETTYDTLGRVSSTSLPQVSAGWSYDANTVSSDLFESYTYDALSRVTSVTNVLGTTSTDYVGFTKTVTDALGNQKDYVNDAFGRLTAVVEYIDGTTNSTHYTWDAADRLTILTDALGNVRNFIYDGRGLRLTAQDLHESADTTYGTWTYTYDVASNLATSLSPNGVTVTYGYDELNRQTSEDASDEMGVEVTFTYDDCSNGTGQLCTAAVAGGTTTSYTYDAADNKASEGVIIDGTNYTTSFTYDRQGNILTTTHPDDTIVTNTYNALGLLKTVSSGADVVSATDYGPHGQLISQTNGNGTVTTYTYDESQRYRLTRKVTTGYEATETTTTASFFPATGDGVVSKKHAFWNTVHDAKFGSSANATSTEGYVRSGKTALGKYQIDRLFLPFDTASLPDDAIVTAARLTVYVQAKMNADNDGDDFITLIQTSQPSLTTLSVADYDVAGDVHNSIEGIDTSERKDISTLAVRSALSFTLNETGRDFVSTIGPTLLGLREGHDVTDNAFVGSADQYNALQIRLGEFFGTSFDPVLEVTYTTADPIESTLQDLIYTYDAVGNITQIVDASDLDSAKTTDYIYDDLYRLKSASVTGAANGNDGTITYTYDALGNITSRSDLGTYSYQGDTDDLMANPHAVTSLEKPDGTTLTYTYDNNGNLTSDGITNHEWDYKNRLVANDTVDGVAFAYDHARQRVSKSSNETTTHYPSPDYSVTEDNVTVYVRGPAGLAASIESNAMTATTKTIHTDHLGSTSVVTDEAGSMVELLDYHPYGTERISWSSASESGEAEASKTYIGEYSDDETNLSYLNARYYDPARGQFLSQDSVYVNLGTGDQRDAIFLLDPQSQNSYLYSRGNPIGFVDSNGEFWDTVFDAASVTYNLGRSFYYMELSAYASVTGNTELQTYADQKFMEYFQALAFDLGALAVPFVPAGLDDVTKYANRLANGGKTFLARDFATNLRLIKPQPGNAYQAHHMLPQAPGFEAFFKRAGINIHDPKYGAWWKRGPDGTHQKQAHEYNNKWQTFIDQNPNATQQEIHDFANGMAKDYGLDFSI
ncbi:MAG: DUF2380 domain-containing protein [Candidatus Kerfeldbacteria bacterium]|nr:DUF2380 domain-containing protein [Candidatus Kerfeldbacteria bacterium]